ncbi:DUF2786 domain-containing protein [Actinomadura welshii]|uniref:DUF2786 domain-containing protein n=1 Tax=Actinomadura welshii TaxID=3103817 RepID=UPI0003AD0705|nr:DUF2786 domain-containing protein [Actinomadura madurae]
MRKAWRRGRAPSGESSATSAEDLPAGAVRALSRGDGPLFRALVAELAERPDLATTDRVLARRLHQGVTHAWERGWQPADVVRFTSRRRTARHARLVTDAITAEMRAYSAATVDDRWQDQLAALGAEVWWPDDDAHATAWCAREHVDRAAYITCALELVHLLQHLPRLPTITPPPGTETSGTGEGADDPRASDRRRGGARREREVDGPQDGHQRLRGRARREVDQRTLGRVRALLAKAESTEYPEEAEALSARAQELMARHSIDHALLAAETGDLGGPDGWRIAVDNPYEAPKAVLLTVVADANRCRAVWHRELGFSTVLGFPADLAAVEMLFTSLLVQATSAMVRAGSRRDARGRSRTRSFRHAFLNAYAARIGERLREAAEGAAGSAAAGAGGKDLLPVLAARDRAVDQAVDTMFPALAKGRAGTVSNYEGWVAGRAAADLASLNGRSEVTGAFRGS